MKKAFLLIVISFVFLSCNTEKSTKNRNTISAYVDGIVIGDKIVLFTTDPINTDTIFLDSTTVKETGYFSLSTTVKDCIVTISHVTNEEELSGNRFCSGRLNVPLFLEGYDDLRLAGDIRKDQKWSFFDVEGGIMSHPEIKKWNRKIKKGQELLIRSSQIIEEQENAENPDPEKLAEGNKLEEKAFEIFLSVEPLKRKFIKKYPTVAYSALLMKYDAELQKNIEAYEDHFLSLSPAVQASPAGITVRKIIDRIRSAQIHGVAPEFNLFSENGAQIKLSDFRGKYVILDFWGSWCGPCRVTSPVLVELYTSIKDNENIRMVGIACSENGEENWRNAIREDHLEWIQLIDKEQGDGITVRNSYAIEEVPYLILISPEGTVLLRDHPLNILPQIKTMLEI